MWQGLHLGVAYGSVLDSVYVLSLWMFCPFLLFDRFYGASAVSISLSLKQTVFE